MVDSEGWYEWKSDFCPMKFRIQCLENWFVGCLGHTTFLIHVLQSLFGVFLDIKRSGLWQRCRECSWPVLTWVRDDFSTFHVCELFVIVARKSSPEWRLQPENFTLVRFCTHCIWIKRLDIGSMFCSALAITFWIYWWSILYSQRIWG